MGVKVEMLVRMNVNGAWRYPGEVVEVASDSDAADMVALWQAKRVPALLVRPATEDRNLTPEDTEQPADEQQALPPALRPPRGKYRSRDVRVSR